MTTYATLKTDVATYLHKSSLTSVIPTFVRLAEARIRNDVRVPAMQSSIDLTVSSESVSLPANFLDPIRLYVDEPYKREILFRPPSVFHRSNQKELSGTPEIVTIEGQNMLFAPVPTSSATVKLLYWAAFDVLSADSDTNWLMTYHYPVYLYATCAEGAAYLEDDQQAQKWGQQYAQAVSMLSRRSKWAVSVSPMTKMAEGH